MRILRRLETGTWPSALAAAVLLMTQSGCPDTTPGLGSGGTTGQAGSGAGSSGKGGGSTSGSHTTTGAAGASSTGTGGGASASGTGGAASTGTSASGTGGGSACTVSPLSDLVSWWHADKVDWNTVDWAGREMDVLARNHGQAQGAAASFAAGQQGNAYSFPNNWYVEVPDSPSLDVTGAMSIEAWVATNGGGPVVHKASSTGSADGFSLAVQGSQVSFAVGAHVVTGGSLTTSAFSHVVGTFDGSSLALYVDGAQVGNVAASGPIPTSASSLRIGADHDINRFSGKIDEVRFWKAALTPEQVASQHTGTGCAVADPIRWNFEGAPMSRAGCTGPIAQASPNFAAPGFSGFVSHVNSGCDTGGKPWDTDLMGLADYYPYMSFTLTEPFEITELRWTGGANPVSPYDMAIEISAANAPTPNGAGFTQITTMTIAAGLNNFEQGPYSVGLLGPGTYFLRWRPITQIQPDNIAYWIGSVNLIGKVP